MDGTCTMYPALYCLFLSHDYNPKVSVGWRFSLCILGHKIAIKAANIMYTYSKLSDPST